MRSQGELNLPSKRFKSISKTECSTIISPRVFKNAGSGWVVVLGLGMMGLILATVAVKYRFGNMREYETTQSEFVENNDSEVCINLKAQCISTPINLND